MGNNKCSIPILVILSLCFSYIAPLFATGGDDEDCDDNGFDFNIGGGLTAIPAFFPDFDYHRGRKVTRLPGTLIPAAPVAQKAEKEAKCQNDQANVDGQAPAPTAALAEGDANAPPALVKKPDFEVDNGKTIVNLDHGNPDDPFMVTDNSVLYLGLLVGGSIREGHSGVQFNLLSKWQLTRGESSSRYADNYAKALAMKSSQTPEEAVDFADWELGDWTRKNGIAGLTLYGGAGWVTADVRVGGTIRGIWSRMIQKLGESLIRVTFTRELEGGPVLRNQLLPFQKSETKYIINAEDTRVYLFDLTKGEDREALELVINKNMLPAKSLAEELAENGKGTTLTTRQVDRRRRTTTPWAFGLPFLYRIRFSNHSDGAVSVIRNHRNNTDTTITSKSYLKQDMRRHINSKNDNDEKKWKYFSHTHQNYNRSYSGYVTSLPDTDSKDGVAKRSHHLDVQISFNHDNVKVKKVNKYLKRISDKIGLHDMIIDTGYDKDDRIGFVEIVYSLKVGKNALKTLIDDNEASEDIYTNRANDLMDEYFDVLKDPHELCDSSHDRLRKRCIRNVRKETVSSLRHIKKYLHKLNTDDVKESQKKSALYLAKIAKELSTNHLVLQSFILSLPPRPNGYGKLEIYGEGFYARRLPVDPNVKRGVEILPEDVVEEGIEDGTLIIDWDGINAREDNIELF